MALTAEYTMLVLNFRWLQGGHKTNAKNICTPLYLQQEGKSSGSKTQDLLNKDMVRQSLEHKSAKYKQHTQPDPKGNCETFQNHTIL